MKQECSGVFLAAGQARERQIAPRAESARKQGTVVVIDPCCSRRERTALIIADCGGKSHCSESQLKDPSTLPCSSQILIVGLESQPNANASALSALRLSRQPGLKLIVLANGLERWPLRDRCILHLTGASHLLDSATADFDHKLRYLLRQMLSDAAAQVTEDRRIRDIMARLGVVGASEAMVRLFRIVSRISPLSQLPVLLTGETGTGKELLAHAIHALDPNRCKGPFIAVNCAALSPTLAESELFGYRRGTFTGAERDRKGLIRAASGGVLFLDEIGDLGIDLQPKLLRVLQENRVLTLGEDEEVLVNVRVIAATNQDLRELTNQRKFRADLFQRLNVLPVRVPCLRERTSDIEPLARYFLAKHSGLRPDDPLEIAPDFFEALKLLEMPENVRQLENIIRQAIVRKEPGIQLTLIDLPPEILLQLCKEGPVAHPTELQSQTPTPIRPSLDNDSGMEVLPLWEGLLRTYHGNLVNCLRACERSLLSVVMQSAHGNQSQMARVMGITARSVYSKLRKHGLQT